MKKLFLGLTLALLLLSSSVNGANADCSTVYGGGTVCNYAFKIEKFVQTPGKGGGNFVENLNSDGPKYSPNQNVSFHLTVTNTGSNTIPTITIVDTFPQFTSFVSGPGSFDTNNKTLTFSISNLGAGQSSTYTVVGKVGDTKVLPNNSVVCLLNQVVGTDNNGVSNSDSSQFCVQKKVAPVLPAPKVVKTPPTGPEMLPLAMLLPGALGGFMLRKKSKLNSIFKGGEK